MININADYVAWFGLVLGIANLFWNIVSFFISLRQNRVRLRFVVTYRQSVPELGLVPNNINLTWNIANLSPFSIYINSIGFCPCSSPCLDISRYPIPDIYITSSFREKTNLIFPLKLDSHDAIVFSLADGNQIEQARERRYMYVSTNCGVFLAKKIPFPSKVFSRPRKVYI